MPVRLENICKRFQGHQALNKVSFSIPQRKVFGLLGPNGAGKTTLIRIITNIIRPDEGKVYFHDKELSEDDLRKFGYLPEERGLYRKMEVFEQAVYLGMLKGLSKKMAKARVEYWMKRWDIAAWKKKKVEELSKGMQQKIQFMVALLHEPEFLILDEPFSGFDPVNAQLLKDEILNLKNSGTTILFSSHNMNNVEEICDEIVLIHKSEKILEGNVWELRKSFFENMYDFVFEGNVMGFTNSLWTAGEVISSKQDGNTHTLRIKLVPEFELNKVLEMLMPVCKLVEIRRVLPTLHDIFVKSVTGKNETPSTGSQTE
jgi:ABC-2 type transport system ATP-binding protein